MRVIHLTIISDDHYISLLIYSERKRAATTDLSQTSVTCKQGVKDHRLALRFR